MGGQNDFFSVAVHELAHVLGYGPAESWASLINGSNQFTGSAATAANGGTRPSVHSDGGHWAAGTNSTIGGMVQQAAMTPSITVGTRKYFTDLDFAGADDLGWDLAGPGDADVDGNVDLTDLGILATNYGQASGRRWALGDFNYSGTVDLIDLTMLATYYDSGQSQAFSDFQSLTVPEPGLAGLLQISIPIMLRRRK